MGQHAVVLDENPTEIILAKSICIVACFFSAILGYAFSLKLNGSPRLLALGGALSAGVMLSAGLVHLLPSAGHGVRHLSEEIGGYPLAPLLAGLSFVVLIVVEKVVEAMLEKTEIKQEDCKKALDCVDESKKEDNHHNHEHEHEHGACEHGASYAGKVTEAQAVIICLAINFHAIMEGLAMGSAAGAKSTWAILAALLSHKGLEAFAVGAAVVQAGVPLARFWLYGVIFAVCTPLGIGIGWACSQSMGGGEASGVCTALAAGTFLWVACMEFLPHAFASKVDFGKKCLTVFLGFGVFSLIAIWC